MHEKLDRCIRYTANTKINESIHQLVSESFGQSEK